MGIQSSNITENPGYDRCYRVHLPGNVTLEFFRTKEMLHVPKIWRYRKVGRRERHNCIYVARTVLGTLTCNSSKTTQFYK